MDEKLFWNDKCLYSLLFADDQVGIANDDKEAI